MRNHHHSLVDHIRATNAGTHQRHRARRRYRRAGLIAALALLTLAALYLTGAR